MFVQVAQRVTVVEQKLSRGWGGENAYHVSGYRYLLIDRDRSVSRATPTGKVTTLTKVWELPKTPFVVIYTLMSEAMVMLIMD